MLPLQMHTFVEVMTFTCGQSQHARRAKLSRQICHLRSLQQTFPTRADTDRVRVQGVGSRRTEARVDGKMS